MRSEKLIIIGLDGMSFSVLEPYFQRGCLPNIEALIRGGVSGDLRSTVPPVTGPSWVSFMTGMWPGKHGIFDFVKPVGDGVMRRFITFHDITAPTVWEYLHEAGRKVGVVNLPITYPPPALDGFIIPGMLTPSTDGEFAHPSGIMAELRKAIGGYVFDVWWHRYGPAGTDQFLDDLQRCTIQRIKAMRYLMDSRDWDVFMGVFVGTDRIQHYLWKYIHPQNQSDLNQAEKKIVSRVEDYYRRLDNYIGELKDRCEKKADLLIISDHGFGPLKGRVFINRWLEKKGYLSVRWNRHILAAVSRRAARLIRLLFNALQPTGKSFSSDRKSHLPAYEFLNSLDWKKTIAYSVSNTEQGIYINRVGTGKPGVIRDEEYESLREQIIHRLQTIKDPDTGRRISAKVYRREELYEGPFVRNAPDIVFFLDEFNHMAEVQLKRKVYKPADGQSGTGTHRLNGILIGYGPHVRQGGTVSDASIVDVAPTVLAHQGLAISDTMEGSPLMDIFTKSYTRGRRATYRKGSLDVERSDDSLTKRDSLEIEKRLRDLGYLD